MKRPADRVALKQPLAIGGSAPAGAHPSLEGELSVAASVDPTPVGETVYPVYDVLELRSMSSVSRRVHR